jgi:hypothetical protein
MLWTLWTDVAAVGSNSSWVSHEMSKWRGKKTNHCHWDTRPPAAPSLPPAITWIMNPNYTEYSQSLLPPFSGGYRIFHNQFAHTQTHIHSVSVKKIIESVDKNIASSGVWIPETSEAKWINVNLNTGGSSSFNVQCTQSQITVQCSSLCIVQVHYILTYNIPHTMCMCSSYFWLFWQRINKWKVMRYAMDKMKNELKQ